ncbi:putative cytochrome c-552 (plasmid) [Sinorhizobium sojae CCBAU 05684]|uniref:Putative cytochrome c-552 n=1 Tax=Sinorhizobium sojae CCBAU 05684 TaxID=716928 RepID=A0A249PL66_9HYPH|nr:c-type cytochrome [Sinorhizobium sojae]ASY66049.1 putative cytochrome c-552 [Sinorhizobium sojae CCBAU 05684]
MDLKDLHWTTIAKMLALAGAGVVVVAAVVVWSGAYNVAASRDHLRFTTWLFEVIRERSIAVRSYLVKAPALDDEGMVRLGAGHFEGGCVPCHSRPGEEINAIVSGMLPPPPDLRAVGEHRSPEEIFWIVKHGMKYTGMPAWPSLRRDDEIWAVTAFLARLPDAADHYAELSGLTRSTLGDAPGELASSRALTQCARCHENERNGTNGDRVPRLAGQNEAYLLRSLREFAEQVRPSGAMEPVAGLLDDDERRRLASYYSALGPAAKEKSAPTDAEQIRRGQSIALRGIPQQQVPACMSCHAGRQSPQFPLIAGQHADYIKTQLHLWQQGGRRGTAYGRIMAVVAEALEPAQIEDVAAYFAAQSYGVASPATTAEAAQ